MNSTSFTTDPLNKWIFSNEWMIPFFQIDSPMEEDDTSVRKHHLESAISKLETFYETRLVPEAIEKPYIPHLSRTMLQTPRFLAHIHFFLQEKLYKERLASHKTAVERTRELIEQLKGALETKTSIVIMLDNQKLARFLLSDSDVCIRIASKDSSIVSEISSYELMLGEPETQANVMSHILFGAKNSVDRKTMFLSENPLQEKFEQMLFHDGFVFKRDVSCLFADEAYESPSRFLGLTLELVKKMADFFRLTDSTDASVLSILLFRAIFNNCYTVRPSFFQNDLECVFSKHKHLITAQNIGLKPEFLKNGSSVEDPVIESVPGDESLRRAANEITVLGMYSNPLDALTGIYRALIELRHFASEKSDADEAQSFDTVFGLFLFALICSDLPDQERVFKFITDFSPMDGLSGPLEYARATVSACILHCSSIVNEVTNVCKTV